MSRFTDHFAPQAASYASFRPTYPPEMIAAIAGLAPAREVAWDCATGSGQGAVLVAAHFDRVVATDASASQIAHARPAPNVEYRIAAAERSGLPDASVDLVTVAQALHWFDVETFYAEVDRVLRPSGVLAVWMYFLFTASPDVDAVIEWFYSDRVGQYWPPERRHVESGYSTLGFPYPAEPIGSFSIESHLDRTALLGFVGSWSAVARCRAAEGRDPLPELDARLAEVWPDATERRRIVWPILLKVGRRPRAPA
jgi:SAM-dependent methyltransferase